MSKVDWWERYCSIVVTPTNSRVKTCPPFKKQTTILGVTITQSSASQQRIPPLFIAWGRDATLYGAAFGWAGLGDAGHRKGSPSDPGETATQVHGAHTFSWGWGDLNLNFSFYMYIYIFIEAAFEGDLWRLCFFDKLPSQAGILVLDFKLFVINFLGTAKLSCRGWIVEVLSFVFWMVLVLAIEGTLV